MLKAFGAYTILNLKLVTIFTMKTFIFLLIVIVALFSYIFTSGGNNIPSQQQPESIITQVPTLEMIEESPQHNYASELNSGTAYTDNLDEDMIYNSKTPSIPEYMTFDKFKAILLEINPYYPKSAITLNLPLSSVIRTKQEREAFREKMQNDFHLPVSEIDQMMQQNKLIWDWINRLR